jgi:DNA modification methylase
VKLYQGDCLEILPTLEANSVDTIITDPPYGLTFMGKDWDKGVPGEAFWRAALRVAKPGAILMAFGGTRTYHRLMVAIEDAGWEIRDCMMWLYGSGFPKSMAIDKAIDKKAAAVRKTVGRYSRPDGSVSRTAVQGWRSDYVNGDVGTLDGETPITAPATPLAQQWQGWGTALKPAYEPIIIAQKPLDGTYAANAEKWGVAGLWIDGGRVGLEGMENHRTPAKSGLGKNGIYGKSTTEELTEGRDLVRYSSKGRWPANLILDEDAAAALDAQSGVIVGRNGGDTGNVSGYAGGFGRTQTATYRDTGGASRFFYTAKASRAERNFGLEGMEARERVGQSAWAGKCNVCDCRMMLYGKPTCGHDDFEWVTGKPTANHHPTVKPLALMRYLARLTKTPTGGVVLDMFAGSGTGVMAALLEGRDAIGIELDAEYFEIMTRRVEAVQAQIEAEQAKPLQLALAAD